MKLIKSLLSVAISSTIAFNALAADMIVYNSKIDTYDGQKFSAFSVTDGRFEQLTNDKEQLLKEKTADTIVIDAQGRRVIPGLNDSHLHVVRGGRFYNLETRWEGSDSLATGLEMIKQNAKVTPKGQWVRVIGGWSPYQFKEKRLPTSAELTEAAPDTPVFVLHLYSGGVLNKKAMQVLGITKNTVPPKGSYYEKDANGELTGRLVADPNPMILYKTIAALPQLSAEEQLNSSKHYYNKLLSLGVTSVIDAGGGGHTFPENYQASTALAVTGELPIRVSNYLFPQTPGKEIQSFTQWMSSYNANQDLHSHMDNGYVIEGGGELLAWSASDYENFTSGRPDLAADAEDELEKVVRLHLLQGWPFRIHATYDQSIERMLTVFEEINKTQPFNKVRWIIDHAETVSDKNLARIKKLGGAIAVQGRMAFAGEDFAKRYGKQQTKRTPPIKKMLAMGIPVGFGTDGTRVASFNPWATYYWAVSGKTVGGYTLYDKTNTLDRLTALQVFTQGSAYFSGEEMLKGQIEPGMYADFAILNQDILTVTESKLLKTQAELTVVDGKVQYAAKQSFPKLHKPLQKALPAWSPVNQ
ncbi:amidohydrolase [Pseudoalteromonas sp. SCQQ13]|uniref:amidohydrolase n=1 Tax=Pseudoalteromonas sp. SCQQ13 TaxID=2792066 RepID=UPI0018CD0533|nr:amidohydrolase [Pseudoalteromonas sp. SCQQ13]MBH0092872.1 amidohydrolase [Pseudoalteromonas sp. SCQQ13]